MAHTFDTSASNPASTVYTANPNDTSYTCGAGATVLVALINYLGVTARSGGAPTYNSVELTQADTDRGVTEASVEVWYMLDPPTGSAYTLSVPNAGSLNMVVVTASAKAQSGYTSVFDAVGYTETTGSNPSVTTNSTAGGIVFAVVGTGDNAFAPSDQTGTNLYAGDLGSTGRGVQYLIENTTGARAMSWTEATSEDYGAIAVSFKESPLADVLVSKDVASGVPAVDKATIGQKHVLVSTDVASGIPAVDKATIAQVHALVSKDIATPAPTVDKPTLEDVPASVTDDLTSKDISSGVPAVDKPTIGQVHALVSTDIATPAPTVDKPTLEIADTVDDLVSVDVASGIPAVDKPTVGQVHALTASDITTPVPVVDKPTLSQSAPAPVDEGSAAGYYDLFRRRKVYDEEEVLLLAVMELI